MSPEDPIGVFDSGVGGLSVLREIRRELPQEDLLYVADSKYAPYGDLSDQAIEQRTIAITQFVVSESAKAIVVACNTATGVAIETLRCRFSIPVVAMEPAVKPASLSTRSDGVGVLATLREAEEFSDFTDHGLAMHAALQENVSRHGRNSGHGNGFRDLFIGLAHLNADLRFRSGDHALLISGPQPELKTARLAQKSLFQGFLVAVRCQPMMPNSTTSH